MPTIDQIHPRSVLILGAGELGSSILDGFSSQLTSESHISITVALRPQALASPAESQYSHVTRLQSICSFVQFIPCDLTSSTIEELSLALKSFDIVIGATGFGNTPDLQLKIARAVIDAEVPIYVPWQFGVDYDVIGLGSPMDLFDEQLEVRKLLRSPGNKTNWLIMSTGIFMSFMLQPSFGVVDLSKSDNSARVRALGDWSNSITVTSADDIGRATAAILLTDTQQLNQVLYIAGDTISYSRIAELVERLLNRKVVRELWERNWLEKELAKNPDDKIVKYRAVFAEGKGISWDLEKTWNKQNGMELLDFESFLNSMA